MKWYIHTAGRKEGPYSIEELRAKISSGQIAGEIFVWKEGFAAWKKLTDVPELAEIQQLAGSTPPPITLIETPKPSVVATSKQTPAKRDTTDLSVFTEMPKTVMEKTGIIDSRILKDLKKEAKSAEKITQKETKKKEKQPLSAEAKKKLLLIPLALILFAGGGAAYYFLNRPKPIVLPALVDLDSPDYERLKMAVSAPVDQIGARLEIARSTEDLAHPHFYLSTNLPDNTQVDITIKQVPGTAVEPSSNPTIIHVPNFVDHLAHTDKVPLSEGEYTVVVTGGPNFKTSLAAAKIFLGGKRDAAYTAALEQAHAKRRERATAELTDINQGVAQMDTFQLLIQKMTELSKSQVINQKVINNFHEFQNSWDEAEKNLPARSEFWHPEVTEASVVYSKLLQLGRETWATQKQVDESLKKIFTSAPAQRPPLFQPLSDQINKATQSFALLKAEIAKTHPGDLQ
jgi:hypothetical protein